MTHTAHHLSHPNHSGTACGEPWQGWQAPKDLDLKDPYAETLPPETPPRPHTDQIRQCQACLQVALHCGAPPINAAPREGTTIYGDVLPERAEPSEHRKG